MPINATTSTTNFELVPAGNHIARCYQMVEIGTVEEHYNGEIKNIHKVRITWELPFKKKVFNPEKGEQPFSVSKEYTLSMHEKATLRKDLSSWRGRGFTESEATRFDITKLIGVPCMVNVVHTTAKNGNVYANVASISPIPEGMNAPAQINETFIFSYEEFDSLKFSTLPPWLQDRMKVTPEYRKATGNSEPKKQEDPSDDLPF